MRNGTPPERPDFLDHPSDRVRARQAQIERYRVKLERTYHSWITCRSAELREMLEAAGYDVYCASNGKEALDLLHEADPPPGLILLDLMMPIMTGEEMLAALKQVHALAAIPVTIVSGHDTPPEGAPYLKKPVDFGALLGVVQKTCG